MENTFASRIRELRTMYGKTQLEFAKLVGTTQSALSGYESGDRAPSSEILLSIAQGCNVSIDWLFGLSDKMRLNDQITTYKEFLAALINVLDVKYQNVPDDRKNLVDMIPEKDIDTIYRVLVRFVPEDEPTQDELVAIADAKADRTPTIPHEAINWDA